MTGIQEADFPPESLQLLVQRIAPQCRLLRAQRLPGGVSARVTALEVERPAGDSRKLIVRQHGTADLRANPHIACDEYRLLQIVVSHGVAAPEPIAYDDACDLFSTPVLVIEYVDGETDFAPHDVDAWLSQAAAELVKIHTISDTAELAFLPRQADRLSERPAQLDLALNEGRIRDALEAAGPPVQTNAPVLLHGDCWPGNLLWRAGTLVAVIDWEDARVGDPLADLGNTRMEVLFFLGRDAMRTFTRHYLAQTAIDIANLPYWDLRAALRPCGKVATWGLDPTTEATIRSRHHEFVTQAIQILAGGSRR
jgi:aminoglycoside phosphotransferase (APT) family kinase protein